MWFNKRRKKHWESASEAMWFGEYGYPAWAFLGARKTGQTWVENIWCSDELGWNGWNRQKQRTKTLLVGYCASMCDVYYAKHMTSILAFKNEIIPTVLLSCSFCTKMASCNTCGVRKEKYELISQIKCFVSWKDGDIYSTTPKIIGVIRLFLPNMNVNVEKYSVYRY